MTWPRGLRVDAEDSPGGWWGQVWPVGGLYFSINDTNPATLLGFGTWTLFGQGAIIMGAPAAVVTSVTSAPSSVHTEVIPTAAVFCWQRVS